MHLAKSSYTGTADILSLECRRELKLVFGWQWMKLWDQHTECSEKGANTIQWLNILWLILQSIKGREKSTYLYLSLLQAFYSSSPIFSTFTIQYLLKNITFQFLTCLLFHDFMRKSSTFRVFQSGMEMHFQKFASIITRTSWVMRFLLVFTSSVMLRYDYQDLNTR